MTPKAAPSQYRMSFSTGGLFVNESIVLAGLYRDLEDWEAVKSAAVEAVTLPFPKASSARRSIREIVNRLRCLSDEELELLQTGERSESTALLWLAACRAYRFVGEFAAELVNERFLSFRTDLALEDFDIFLEAKVEWHPDLAALSASTRNKLRQVLFRMMREAEILSADDRILGAMLTPRLENLLRSGNAAELRFFPGGEKAV